MAKRRVARAEAGRGAAGLRRARLLLAVGALSAAAVAARAEDATGVADGRRLAVQHCAACHAVAPRVGTEVADAPPFGVIGAKYGHATEAIRHAILGPHPKMNFMPAPADAAAIARYIATLQR